MFIPLKRDCTCGKIAGSPLLQTDKIKATVFELDIMRRLLHKAAIGKSRRLNDEKV
jgi:hypothetical protein